MRFENIRICMSVVGFLIKVCYFSLLLPFTWKIGSWKRLSSSMQWILLNIICMCVICWLTLSLIYCALRFQNDHRHFLPNIPLHILFLSLVFFYFVWYCCDDVNVSAISNFYFKLVSDSCRYMNLQKKQQQQQVFNENKKKSDYIFGYSNLEMVRRNKKKTKKTNTYTHIIIIIPTRVSHNTHRINAHHRFCPFQFVKYGFSFAFLFVCFVLYRFAFPSIQ